MSVLFRRTGDSITVSVGNQKVKGIGDCYISLSHEIDHPTFPYRLQVGMHTDDETMKGAVKFLQAHPEILSS